MKERSHIILKYTIAASIGAALVLLYLAGHPREGLPPAEVWRIWCDAFTVPGMLIFLTGVLVWLSGEGVFLGLGYAVSYMVRMLIPGMGHKHERYADYIERKTEKGKAKGYAFLFVVGGVMLLAAAVFLVLFYRAYTAPAI